MSQRLAGLSQEQATGTAKLVYEAADRSRARMANLQGILATQRPYLGRWLGGLVAVVRQPDFSAALGTR